MQQNVSFISWTQTKYCIKREYHPPTCSSRGLYLYSIYSLEQMDALFQSTVPSIDCVFIQSWNYIKQSFGNRFLVCSRYSNHWTSMIERLMILNCFQTFLQLVFSFGLSQIGPISSHLKPDGKVQKRSHQGKISTDWFNLNCGLWQIKVDTRICIIIIFPQCSGWPDSGQKWYSYGKRRGFCSSKVE